MKVSLFCVHMLPRPWSADSEFNTFQESLDQLELADRLGFHEVWATSITLEEYCHSTAPEVFLAAVSQRTKDIRLGHGIIQLLPETPTIRPVLPNGYLPWTCCRMVGSTLVRERVRRPANSRVSSSTRAEACHVDRGNECRHSMHGRRTLHRLLW